MIVVSKSTIKATIKAHVAFFNYLHNNFNY